MSNERDMIILLILILIKRNYKMSQYFTPYRSFGRHIKVELDLSSYTAKTDLKNVTHVDDSSFASKTNLASSKTVDKIVKKVKKVDKIDISKLTPVPDDLAKLSNAAKMMLLKRLNMIN